MNILHFTPYFPPHIGGLETVADEICKYLSLEGHKNIVLTYDISKCTNYEHSIKFNNKIIGYQKYDSTTIYLLPAFEIIPYFPFPKFWDKNYKYIMKIIAGLEFDIVQTHTRFFVSSFLGGKYAIKNEIPRIHTEHGAEYVKLKNKFFEAIAYYYDRIVGKRIFKSTNRVISISKQTYDFVYNNFGVKSSIIHRGLEKIQINDLFRKNIKRNIGDKIIIGFIGRITERKNVKNIILAYYDLILEDNNYIDKIQLVVVGTGDQLEEMKKLDTKNLIIFTGGLKSDEALARQSVFDIHIHSSYKGGGLATTLLQAMYLGSYIVSTPYEGGEEMIKDSRNGTLLKDCSNSSIKNGIKTAIFNLDNKKLYGSRNKKIIEKEFTWEKNIVLYINEYNSYIYKNTKTN